MLSTGMKKAYFCGILWDCSSTFGTTRMITKLSYRTAALNDRAQNLLDVACVCVQYGVCGVSCADQDGCDLTRVSRVPFPDTSITYYTTEPAR